MKRILLVEDDALLNKTLTYNLRSEGYDTASALNANTAARLALMNFSRNRKILLLCISAYADSVDAKEMTQSQFGDGSQYLLQYEDYAGREFVDMQKENSLGSGLREELAGIPGVDFVMAYSMTCV